VSQPSSLVPNAQACIVLKRAFIILEKLGNLGFKGQKTAVNLAAIQFLDLALLPFLEQ